MSDGEEFVECDTCRAKPGSPYLCEACLIRRTNHSLRGNVKELEGELKTLRAEVKTLRNDMRERCNERNMYCNQMEAYREIALAHAGDRHEGDENKAIDECLTQCETADCNGIPNICQRCERNRIYAAERAERKRIIAKLNALIERYAAEGINAFSLQAFLNELEGK